ncbi:hypothetical protein RRG08_037744 [Elysia crispata]|uniref:Uncharacterized protein n=1 Tax=Elysia crispata TaxID=231223 RepID=A0AAE1DUE9_9GAST|nr:hypothetical protein RRG08_037744 [Elysia crispata]
MDLQTRFMIDASNPTLESQPPQLLIELQQRVFLFSIRNRDVAVISPEINLHLGLAVANTTSGISLSIRVFGRPCSALWTLC